MSRQFLRLASVVVSILASQSATAQTFDWINTTSGTFSNAANWSPAGGPPNDAAETARFAASATQNVTFAGNATFGVLTQSQGTINMFLNGWTLQPTNTVSNGMGSTGLTSSLFISNGTFLPGNFSVGGNPGSTSTLVLDNGLVTTVGAGVFYVGTSGTGNLTVQTGATLNTSGNTGVGINAAGVGTATVNGPGSIWTVANTLKIGLAGNGTLNVINGGGVTANALEVGENFNSVGSISVSGGNSVFQTSGTANIGGATSLFPAASPTLSIGSAATMSLNGSTNLRATAIVNVNGGTLNLNTLNVSPGAKVNWSAGTVNFANATSITPSVLNLLLAGTSTLQDRTLSATAGLLNLTTNLAVNNGRISVHSLQLNSNVNIGAFGSVVAADSITIEAGKTLQLEDFGTLGATSLIANNGGTLLLNGPLATVTGFMANNFGVIQGTGRFAAGLNNGTGGTIRAAAGDHIIIQQSGLTNPGNIELLGGTVEYTNTLSNLGSGVISGRGVFRGSTSNLGGTGLSNIGVMAFSAGTTDIYGDVLNTGGGKIVAAGGSVVTFHDDVTHNGAEIRTNAGSRTVFFGALTGAGPFPGSGVVESNGDLKPGNSAAEITFAGDVELGATSGLEIELGGTIKGARYDALTIAGTAMLSGGLDVSLINDFIPLAGDTFEILTAGEGRIGIFDEVTLPALGGGIFLDVDYDANSVTLAVAGIPGDYNRDGTVDAADFSIWRSNFGESLTTGGGAAANSVPEPAPRALLVALLCCVIVNPYFWPPARGQKYL